MSEGFRTGFVSVVGRPNVGKSTLINRLVGHKVSITSRRPQTTRHRILGIRTDQSAQVVLVDTPGLHSSRGSRINRVINRTARNSFAGVDLLVLMINAGGWTDDDILPLDLAAAEKTAVVLVINKIDRLADKSQLLPLIDESRKRFDFLEIVPVSALKGTNVEELYQVICSHLPEAPKGFPDDQVTDRGERFVVAELIREQLFRQLGDELPYATAVKLERYENDGSRLKIQADIWVERDSHKGILIGEGGRRLKEIGSRARVGIEKQLGQKVFLDLWVKVRRGWRDDDDALEGLGYSE